MSKALEFQPIVQRREFYQIEGIETNNDCAVLSQLVYWANVSGFNEFYKTDEELSEETKVSVHSIRRVKKKLKSLSFVIMTRRGVPAKTYYKVDPHKILEETQSPYIEQCLSEQSSKTLKPQKTQITQIAQSRLSKMHNLDYANCSNKITQIAQSIYRTKNTSKTTTKIKENTAIARIECEREHEHERELSDAEFEHEEQPLSLSDESCVFVESEYEKDQDALKAHEIISTLQSEILTETRKIKDEPRPDYIAQSNSSINSKLIAKNDDFEVWWNTYSHKVDKKIALKAYIKATRRIKPSELAKRTLSYLRLREALKKGSNFVPTLKNPATWLNNDCWDDEDLKNMDTSTPQEKEQTALDEIRFKYQGPEAMVREQLFKALGNPYFVYLSEAEISFDHKTAHVLVGGPTAQDELRGSYSYQVKNAFKHADIEQLIIKNIKKNSPDVSLMI